MSDAGKTKRIVRGQVSIPLAGKDKIYLATPAYGGLFSVDYVRSLYMLLSARPKRQLTYVFSEFDYADIVVARNYLISDFYFNHADCSHILFVDDDMGFDSALISEMHDLNESVVGVMAPKRRIDLRRLHAAKDLPFETAYARALDFIGDIRKPQERKGPFVSVNSCGTGVMLISRACISEMMTKKPEIVDARRFRRMPFAEKFETRFLTPFDKIRDDDYELSEDISFCRRWIDCGGKIWAHTNHPIRHAGSIVVSGKYSDRS
jgi:hypothetical protein